MAVFTRILRLMSPSEAVTRMINLYGPYNGPYGVGAPIPLYAMSAQRYMHEYGVSAEAVAEVPVALRNNAAKNPDALYRDPITVDEVLARSPDGIVISPGPKTPRDAGLSKDIIAAFRRLGVQRVAPCHCTGDRARRIADQLPDWGEDLWDALQPERAEHAEQGIVVVPGVASFGDRLAALVWLAEADAQRPVFGCQLYHAEQGPEEVAVRARSRWQRRAATGGEAVSLRIYDVGGRLVDELFRLIEEETGEE